MSIGVRGKKKLTRSVKKQKENEKRLNRNAVRNAQRLEHEPPFASDANGVED
jgi:hypothetical protein